MAAFCNLPAVEINVLNQDTEPLANFTFDFYNQVMSLCCGNVVASTVNHMCNQSLLVEHQMVDIRNSSVVPISLPVVVSTPVMASNAPKNFIRVQEFSHLVMIATLIDYSGGGAAWTAFAVIWPLILLIFSLAGFVGYALWFAEMLGASKITKFPRNFFEGVAETFWYSYISATTVGYGDLVAQSKVGRMIALVWITLGVMLFSLLTSSFTHLISVASDSVVTMPEVFGNAIGVKKGTVDEMIVAQLGGNPVPYPSASSLIDALQAGHVKAIVMNPRNYRSDFGLDSSWWAQYGMRGKLMDYSAVVGFVMSNTFSATVPKDLFTCLQETSYLLELKLGHFSEPRIVSIVASHQDITMSGVSYLLWGSNQTVVAFASLMTLGLLIGITGLVFHLKERRKLLGKTQKKAIGSYKSDVAIATSALHDSRRDTVVSFESELNNHEKS